jgi:ABC-type branched-subunit amino acid transport system substrate-binding protein
MGNASQRPTGTQGPLHYAPRRVRDAQQSRDASTTRAADTVPSRVDDVGPKSDDVVRDRPLPWRGMRLPPVQPVPPPPQSGRRAFGILREIALLSLVVVLSAILVVTLYPRKPETDATNTPARTLPVTAQTPGSIAGEPTRAIPPAPRVAVNAPPAPVQTEERASPAPATAAAAVAPLRPPDPPVRGITDTEIRFGIAAPFSGSAKELGRQMKLGIDTMFSVINAGGGINGRKVRLIAADDGYEPSRTADAMKQLFEKDEVFGIVGNVGTPTAMVALPYALEQKMLFFGAFTGAGLLRRDPPDRYVFNYRASYAEETDAMVRYLVKVRRLRPEQIAVFAQQDGYGDAGFSGVAKAVRALQGGEASTILRLDYKRNTVDVNDAVERLRQHKTPIKAVVMVPTYRAAARFIEKTRDLFPAMIYTNVSFVGSTALAEELKLLGPKYTDGVIVTQVVPAIEGYSSLILEYKAALAKYFPGEVPDYVSLEGYIAAGLLAEGLKRAGPQLDTEKIVEALEKLRDFDMGLGTPLTFGRTEHQGSHKVWGTQLDAAGRYQAIDLQ